MPTTLLTAVSQRTDIKKGFWGRSNISLKFLIKMCEILIEIDGHGNTIVLKKTSNSPHLMRFVMFSNASTRCHCQEIIFLLYSVEKLRPHEYGYDWNKESYFLGNHCHVKCGLKWENIVSHQIRSVLSLKLVIVICSTLSLLSPHYSPGGTPPGFGWGCSNGILQRWPCLWQKNLNLYTLFMTRILWGCIRNQSEKAELPCSRCCLSAWWKTIPWIWQETKKIRKLSRNWYPVYDKKLEKPYPVQQIIPV